MCDKGRLHLVKLAGGTEALNGGDFVAIMLDREGKAGIDPLAVYNDRTRTALAVIATLLRSGQAQVFPQGIEKRGAGIEVQLMLDPVYGQFDGHDD